MVVLSFSNLSVVLPCGLLEPVGLSGPKFPGEDVSRTKVKAAGTSFSLQCQGQAHPVPSFR